MKHKNYSQNLQQTLRFFETVLRASSDGIVITDPARNIIFANDTFCKIFSSKRHDLIETNLLVWLAKLDHNANDTWKRLEEQVNEHGIARDVEFAAKTGEEMRFFSVNSSLLEKIDIEEPGIFISIWRDDTGRKKIEQALLQAHNELEMRVKERTAQLAKKNTELKTQIIERKRAEKALRSERDNLVRIFEAMIDGVYIVDKKYDIRYVNPVLEKDFGPYKGRKCYEYFHDRTSGCPWCKNKEVLAGKTVRWEWYSSKNNKTYDLIDTPLMNPDGTIYKLELFRDITERKLAEMEREQFLKFFQISSDLMVISEPDGRFKKINPACLQTLGYSETELMAKPFIYFVHPDDRQATLDEIALELQRGFSLNFENRYRCKDGTIRWLSWRANYNKDEGLTYATARDITEHKRSDDEKNRLLKAIASSTDGITICDEKDHYIYVNAAYARIFGYAQEDFIGETWRKITPSEMIPGVETGLDETLHNKDLGIFKGEVPGLMKDGSLVPTEVIATAVWDEKGNYNGHICIVRDITERKRAEEERIALVAREQAALAEAEAARKLDRMKSMFIASTSHELRTPLNSILGFTSLILDGSSGELNPEQKKLLTIVHSSGKHLLALINDIIDLSMIEAGKLKVTRSEFNLSQVVNEAVSNLNVISSEKNLEIKVNVGDIKMKSDRTRILQCIVNLLGNAIKYTEKGSVNITAKVINGNVEISITDTGIGIKKGDIPKLFGPFVRLQSSLTLKTSGTGLGLYLVKKLARDFLGGDVEVKSEFGKGSKFTLCVPVELEGKL